MKLVISGSALAAALVGAMSPGKMLLREMGAISDECEGCDLAPKKMTTCNNPPCSDTICGKMPIYEDSCEGDRCKVDCGLDRGYYADNTNCRGYCFCSGADNVDGGSGLRVPSRWEMCPAGTVWDSDCFGFFSELKNGMGYKGGCCSHPARVLNFANCPGACERLSKYHCGKSLTCTWDSKCNCCKPHHPDNPENNPRHECTGTKLDITFIIDSSGSIGQMWFGRSKHFIKHLVSHLDMKKSRVAIVEYSTSPMIQLRYTQNYDQIMKSLSDMPYIGRSTQTGAALKFTQEKILPERRKGVPSLVFVLTDGVSYDRWGNSVSIRGPEIQKDSIVFAMGVSKADPKQLAHIASEADADHDKGHVFYVEKWHDAFHDSMVDTITAKWCVAAKDA